MNILYECGLWITKQSILLANENNLIEKGLITDGIRDIAMNLNYYPSQLVEVFYLYKPCGKPSLRHTSVDKPCEKDLCFHCNHWNNIAKSLSTPLCKTDPFYRVLSPINDGYELVHFTPKLSKEVMSMFLGHGGRVFQFEMPWGELLESNNVWSGGYLPKRYHEQLKHRIVGKK